MFSSLVKVVIFLILLEIHKKVNVDAEIWSAAALGLPKIEYDPMPQLLLKKYQDFLNQREKKQPANASAE